jgi:Uma2 family endonuclease
LLRILRRHALHIIREVPAMQPQTESRLSQEEYLAWERGQEARHEYVDGEIFAMTGASREHNLICGNAFALLHTQLRGKPCEVYSNNMRVKVRETGIYTYPDIVAVCGEPRFEDDRVDTLLNPVLIVEILSDSTERYDRGTKFAHYRRLDSFREYLLVAETELRVERYRRQGGESWLLVEYRNPEDQIELESLDCRVKLADIYERVALTASR